MVALRFFLDEVEGGCGGVAYRGLIKTAYSQITANFLSESLLINAAARASLSPFNLIA